MRRCMLLQPLQGTIQAPYGQFNIGQLTLPHILGLQEDFDHRAPPVNAEVGRSVPPVVVDVRVVPQCHSCTDMDRVPDSVAPQAAPALQLFAAARVWVLTGAEPSHGQPRWCWANAISGVSRGSC